MLNIKEFVKGFLLVEFLTVCGYIVVSIISQTNKISALLTLMAIVAIIWIMIGSLTYFVNGKDNV